MIFYTKGNAKQVVGDLQFLKANDNPKCHLSLA